MCPAVLACAGRGTDLMILIRGLTDSTVADDYYWVGSLALLAIEFDSPNQLFQHCPVAVPCLRRVARAVVTETHQAVLESGRTRYTGYDESPVLANLWQKASQLEFGDERSRSLQKWIQFAWTGGLFDHDFYAYTTGMLAWYVMRRTLISRDEEDEARFSSFRRDYKRLLIDRSNQLPEYNKEYFERLSMINHDNKLFVDIAMNWVLSEEPGDYIESRISLSHRYLCMYDVWRGFLSSADTELRSYLCDWIERYAIDELKFPPEFRLKRPEEIGLFLDFDVASGVSV